MGQIATRLLELGEMVSSEQRQQTLAFMVSGAAIGFGMVGLAWFVGLI